jgi:ribosome-associated toxin RatA of RatAB toxin-antitoxin module
VAERTESSITINAAPDAVLDVIADLPSYPLWSEGVRSVEVLEHDGSRPLRARFSVDSGAIKDTYVLAYDWAQDRVTWYLVEAGLLSAMDGEYRVETVPEGTLVTYRLGVELSIPMIGLIRKKAERVVIDTALRGLKHWVESRP